MNYVNAEDVLPQELVREIRRYVNGGCIYIPRVGARSPWGMRTGGRAEYMRRNKEIRRRYKNGDSVSSLAERYCLCQDTIRKIIRKGNKDR